MSENEEPFIKIEVVPYVLVITITIVMLTGLISNAIGYQAGYLLGYAQAKAGLCNSTYYNCGK